MFGDEILISIVLPCSTSCMTRVSFHRFGLTGISLLGGKLSISRSFQKRRGFLPLFVWRTVQHVDEAGESQAMCIEISEQKLQRSLMRLKADRKFSLPLSFHSPPLLLHIKQIPPEKDVRRRNYFLSQPMASPAGGLLRPSWLACGPVFSL